MPQKQSQPAGPEGNAKLLFGNALFRVTGCHHEGKD
jgi:hypothetical protein